MRRYGRVPRASGPARWGVVKATAVRRLDLILLEVVTFPVKGLGAKLGATHAAIGAFG